MKKVIILILFLGFLALPFAVEAASPLTEVQKHVNNVIDALKNKTQEGEKSKDVCKQKLRSISQEMFDFVELSRRTLGTKNWNRLSNEQRSEFVGLYTELLESVYMDRILEYKDEQVVFDKERISKKRAEVQSTIIADSKKIPINYRLILKENGWKVYDVIVEGISLLSNYMSQFQEFLKKNSPDEMIEMLREKVAALNR